MAKELIGGDLEIMNADKAVGSPNQARWFLKKSRDALRRYNLLSDAPISDEADLAKFQKILDSVALDLRNRDN